MKYYTLSSFAVNEEHLKQAKRALAELVAAVRRHEPATLFQVFRKEGEPAFFCLMAFADEAAERAHAQARYVAKFARQILPWCEGKPHFTELGFFAGSQREWAFEPAAGVVAGPIVPMAQTHPRRAIGSRQGSLSRRIPSGAAR